MPGLCLATPPPPPLRHLFDENQQHRRLSSDGPMNRQLAVLALMKAGQDVPGGVKHQRPRQQKLFFGVFGASDWNCAASSPCGSVQALGFSHPDSCLKPNLLQGHVHPSAWRYISCLWPVKIPVVPSPPRRQQPLLQAHASDVIDGEGQTGAELRVPVRAHKGHRASLLTAPVSPLWLGPQKQLHQREQTQLQRGVEKHQGAGFVIEALIYLAAAGIKDIPAASCNRWQPTTRNSAAKNAAFISFLCEHFNTL